jgi:hypothetical protein
MKFQSEIINLGSEVRTFGFYVPKKVAEHFITGKDRRVTCHIEGLEPFHCALLPTGEDHPPLILLNAKRRKKLGMGENDLLTVRLEKDDSLYGMEMPEELEAVLIQDDAGNSLFHGLSPGKMRNVIYHVLQVKSPDIRIRRSLVIVEHLKRNNGRIVFKRLAEEIKEANQRARHPSS